MRSLRFARGAERDLDGLYERGLRTRSPENARQFVRDLRERCIVFQDNPEIGQELGNRRKSRFFAFDRLVVVIYQVRPQEILVLRVLPRGREWRRLTARGGQ